MEINECVRQVHALAVERGWHVENESEVHEKGALSPSRRLAIHMLIVSEISEATEEVRNNMPPIYTGASESAKNPASEEGVSFSEKPEGEAIELVDAVIRIMDYFGFMGWDLDEAIRLKHRYNITRALRHGGKAI